MSCIKNQINYENSKHYWFIAIALIINDKFSSWKAMKKEDLIFQDYTVKTWWGEMGFEDPIRENAFTKFITFNSGAFPDHGVGFWKNCYYDDELLLGYISLTGKFKTVGYIYIIQMVIHL